MTQFATRIAGIPCQIQINQPVPTGETHPSIHPDFRYRLLDFTVLDRNGYVANWLARKIDDSDIEHIYNECLAQNIT